MGSFISKSSSKDSKDRISTTKSQYYNITSQPSTNLAQPSPKLIILDLNGTLVFRKKVRNITLRPFIDEFINYLFNDENNFLVMVWSTARPENVDIMVNVIFEDRRENLIAVWGRDKFGFTEQEYQAHTLSIKNLETVWNALNPQIANFKNKLKNSFRNSLIFDPTNTILIDDSRSKTQLQPYNAIHPREFDRDSVRDGGDTELKKIIEYLELVKYQSNVASYMKDNPFSDNPDGEKKK